jgi:hypothetical protein
MASKKDEGHTYMQFAARFEFEASSARRLTAAPKL